MELIKSFVPDFDYWLVQTLAMMLTALLLPKLKVTSIFGPILAVAALAWINSKFWDLTLFYKIPGEVSLHALYLLLANGVIFYIIIKIVPGIEISGIFPAILAPVIFTLANILIAQYLPAIDWNAVTEFVANLFSGIKTGINK